MATAVKTQGTQLYKIQTATTFITVGNLQNFVPPSPQADEKEITDMSSVAKEFLAMLVDYGSCDFDVNWDPELISTSVSGKGHQALESDAAAGTIRNWLIGFADGNAAPTTPVASAFPTPATTRTWVGFAGFIKTFSKNGGTNAVVSGKLTVRVTGAPTWYYKP